MGSVSNDGRWRDRALWPIVWPVITVLALSFIWILVYFSIQQTRARAETGVLGEAAAAAQAYEQYVTRSLGNMDQVSMQLKQSWEQSGRTLKLDDLVREGMFLDSAFGCVAILDYRGAVRTAVRVDACGTGLAQSEFFAFHRNNNASALRIGSPTGEPSSAHEMVLITRRLDTVDGDFDGIVLLAVRSSYFTSFYLPAKLGQQGMLATVGTESGLRAEQRRDRPGASTETAFPFDAGLWSASSGAVMLKGMQGFPDGASRVLSWRSSNVYPVVTLVALPEDEALADWREGRDALLRNSIFASVAVLLMGSAATLLAKRAQLRRRAREDVSAAYRAATEAANEGFFMVAPVRDRSGRLTDFQIIDCNERGARFHALSRDGMVGKRLSTIDEGIPGASLFDAFQLAMERGFYEDERPMPGAARGQRGWAQRRIVRVGDGLAVTLQDVSERRAHRAELERVSNEDHLTALPNRQWMMRCLPGILAQAGQRAEEAAVLLVDLDDFKHVNDDNGQAVGDLVLQAAAQRLRTLLRPSDRVVRFGGDEFVVLLEASVGTARTERVAARIVEAFKAPVPLAGSAVQVGASVGVTVYPRDGTEVAALLRHAGIAMDAAKAEGKGQYRIYDAALAHSVHTRVQLRQSLLDAIESDQFVLYYQPRVDTRSGELRSMEALLRWIHPQRGLVSPLDFIPLAEASGLIVRLGEMVMRKACAQIDAWRAAGLPLVPVSINVSPKQFARGEVPDQLARALAACDIPAALLEVEITESAMMGEHEDIQFQLDTIRSLGIRLHLDDFGTGYSSLSQLQRLKMDVLKVDRAFTSELAVSREGRVFFQAIVSMAHALGMEVVAEGVENAAQLAILKDLDCNEVQGYLVARPLPASEMAGLMQQRFLFPDPVAV